jgi:hypothetical protein
MDAREQAMISESWGKVITKVGVPSVICLYLVWKLGGDYPMRLDRIEAAVQHTSAQISEILPVASQMQSLVNLQLQACVNAADDYAKRDACFRSVYVTPQRDTR